MSKSHPEQWTVRQVAERPEGSLVTALREFATTQIADCGGPVAIVAPPLRHLAGGAQLCGPAVTVWTKPGEIPDVLKAVDLIAAGDVLVIDGGGLPDAAVIGDIAGQARLGLGCDGWSSTAPSVISTAWTRRGCRRSPWAPIPRRDPTRDRVRSTSSCSAAG